MPGLATAVFSKPARIGAVARVTLTQLVRMKLFLVPAAFAVLVLALLLGLIVMPARLIWKLLGNALCGFGCLIVLNLLSPYTGMLFELNVLTCAVVGLLGLPGIGALLIVHGLLA